MIDAGMRLLYAAGRPLYQKTSELYANYSQRLDVVLGMIRLELTTGPSVSIPLDRRLELWRNGFTSRAHDLLELSEGDYERFLSEYQEGLTYGINGRWKETLDNKLTAHLLMLPFEEHVPALFGLLDEGFVRRYPAYEGGRPPAVTDGAAVGATVDFETTDALPEIERLLAEEGPVVLKPLFGSGGKGVFVVASDEESEGYQVNGETYARDAFADLVDGLAEYAVHEYVEQSSFMDDLYADATNTVRLVTMWDYEAGEPFVAWAHARIGTPESAPLDNISQGGLQAGVDIDTGELTYVADINDKSPPVGVEFLEEHPATGTRLAGRTIPDWTEMRDDVLRIAEGLAECPYIGWDVLPTDDGFQVVETNASPGMINTQIHSQFMADQRVRRFYEHHGVL